MSAHALVLGKFYPPTLGHGHLISAAAANADDTTVVVMASRWESLSLEDRVSWLRAGHPDVSVVGVPCDIPTDFDDPRVWAAQLALMRAVIPAHLPPVDLVVTSEGYGEQLAGWFGASHLCVDPDRTTVAVSGTAVRADLAGHWDLLLPTTRAGLALRVVVLGAESTGTTSVAQGIAAAFRARGEVWKRTRCVGEYGRERSAEMLAEQGGTVDELRWTANDFAAIAAEQQRREDDAAGCGSPLLVCDTDAFTTTIWERRYLGATSLAAPPAGHRRLYLLTDHADVPWVDDGLREGDLPVRAAMTAWFTEALTAGGRPWALLTGSLHERVALAIRTVDLALAHALSFTDPMPTAP